MDIVIRTNDGVRGYVCDTTHSQPPSAVRFLLGLHPCRDYTVQHLAKVLQREGLPVVVNQLAEGRA